MLSNPQFSKALKSMSTKMSSIREQINVLESNRNGRWSEQSNTDKDNLEFDLNLLKASAEQLLSVNPEGNPDGEEVNYFLAVAEIMKMNDSLRQQLQLTEKNIMGTTAEIEASTAWLEDLETINKIIEAKYQVTNNQQKPTKADGPKKETEGSVLDNKIRSTRVLYKRFKSCLSDFLKRDEGTPEDTTDPGLPRLLQSLYDKFQNPDDDGEVYLNLSHVECDLNPEDVSRLVEFGIAEVHPTDPDKLRLIDFTQ